MNFVSSGANSSGDGRGHGTLVASIAANGGSSYTGAEPRANLVSLDVLDDNGNGTVSDVIAACDWILAHKDEYNIRVANFSLNAGGGPFQLDPLNRAVEALWLNGVVVVVALGQLRNGDGAERRRLLAGQRSVRHHRRRVRHPGHGHDERRLRRAVVGVGVHATTASSSRRSPPRAAGCAARSPGLRR